MTHIGILASTAAGAIVVLFLVGLLRFGLSLLAKRGAEQNGRSVEIIDALRTEKQRLKDARRDLEAAAFAEKRMERELRAIEVSSDEGATGDAATGDAAAEEKRKAAEANRARDEAVEWHAQCRQQYERVVEDLDSASRQTRLVWRTVKQEVVRITRTEEESLQHRISLKKAERKGFLSGMKSAKKLLKDQLRNLSAERQILITGGATLAVILGEVLYYGHFNTNVFDYYSGYSVSGVVEAAYLVVMAVVSVVMTYVLIHVIVRAVVLTQLAWIVMSGGALLAGLRLRVPVMHSFFFVFGVSLKLVRAVLSRARAVVRETSRFEEVVKQQEVGKAEESGRDSASRLFGLVRGGAVVLSILTVAAVVMLLEPRYRAHGICVGGVGGVRLVVDPPLRAATDFVRVGAVGSYVFASPWAQYQASRANGESVATRSSSVVGYAFGYLWSLVTQRFLFVVTGEVAADFECALEVVAVPQNRVLCIDDGSRASEEPVCASPTGSARGDRGGAGQGGVGGNESRGGAGQGGVGGNESRGESGQPGVGGNGGGREPVSRPVPVTDSSEEHRFRVFHLRNAVLRGTERGAGIWILGEGREHLEALRAALAACATEDGVLGVEVRGYASSAPFSERGAGGERRAADSDELNLGVANMRARAVREILQGGTGKLEVTAHEWGSFGEMTAARGFRDRKVENEPSDREYLNRSVDIVVRNIGECAVAREGEVARAADE